MDFWTRDWGNLGNGDKKIPGSLIELAQENHFITMDADKYLDLIFEMTVITAAILITQTVMAAGFLLSTDGGGGQGEALNQYI